MALSSTYPSSPAERDAWILSRRPPRPAVDVRRPYAFLMDEERAESGEIISVATLFLTNRECPWKCLMCDLWKNTVPDTVPVGAIPEQIDYGLERLASLKPGRVPDHIKLYNSGSYFDPRAVPPADDPAVAERVRRFGRVIVESHPALVGDRALRFRDLIGSRLEVAMGLETVQPEVLNRLNKRITLAQFERAAEFLLGNDLALRVFVLVKPPFMEEPEALEWACRSIDFALGCGASVVSLIPTRFGNGALEALAESGDFAPPRLATLEAALQYGIQCAGSQARVFADLWDLEQFSRCPACLPARRARLHRMNLSQAEEPAVPCPECESSHAT